MGLTDVVPLDAAEPERPAVHVTDVAFVVDHVSVDELPLVMLVGFADSVTVGSCAAIGLIVTVAEPDFVVSSTEVAVMVAVVVTVIVEEVVSFPFASIVATVAGLAGLRLTDHVTA